MDPNRERERSIVIKGREAGLSNDQIKEAVLRDRQRRGATAPVDNEAQARELLGQTLQPQAREPIQVTPYQPSLIEKIQGFAEKTAPGRLGKAVRGALTTGLTPEEQRQGLGAGVQTLATAGSLAAPGAATLAGRTIQAATAGATSGLGEGIEQGKSVAEIAGQTALGAASGAVLTQGLERGAKGVKKALEGTAEAFYNRLVKTPVKQVEAGKEMIGTGLQKRGVAGTYKQMSGQVNQIARQNKEALDQVIAQNADIPIDTTKVVQSLQRLGAKLKATPGESTDAVQKVLDEFAPEGQVRPLALAQAQELKQNLQEAVNDAFLRQNASGVTQAQKTAAQALRKAIEEAVPDVVPHNRELEFSIRALNQLRRQANLSPSKLRLFTELGLGTYGILANPAVLAGIALERVATEPASATRIGRGLGRAAKKKMNPKASALIERLGSIAAGQGL